MKALKNLFIKLKEHKNINDNINLVFASVSGLLSTLFLTLKKKLYLSITFRKIKFVIFIKTNKFIAKMESFIGYNISDLSDALSLSSLFLIVIKLISFLFSVEFSPIISYLMLLNFFLVFLTLNLYYFFRENLLLPIIHYLLGDHYINDGYDLILDNDERLKLDFNNNFFGNFHYNFKLLFYPYFRVLFEFFVIIRIFILNNLFIGRILIFLLFQLLIFNKMLIFNIILSLILNISRHIFLMSDLKNGNLLIAINQFYGNIFLIKNYKMLSFWILRSLNCRTLFLEYVKKNDINRFNLKYGIYYINNQKNKYNFKIQKRYFSDKKIVSTLELIYLNKKLKNDLFSDYPANIQKLLARGENHFAKVDFSSDKSRINLFFFQTLHNPDQYVPIAKKPEIVCDNLQKHQYTIMHKLPITFSLTSSKEKAIRQNINGVNKTNVFAVLDKPLCKSKIMKHSKKFLKNGPR